jgi:hypothetical protein
MAKYDDMKWHAGGEFPPELPPQSAATHIGMFLGWAIDRGFEGELLDEQFPEVLRRFRQRQATGREALLVCCDGKLIDDFLNNEGNAFARAYYETDMYVDDYADVLGDDVPTLFHVEDDWANYARIKERLDRRYAEWKSGRL